MYRQQEGHSNLPQATFTIASGSQDGYATREFSTAYPPNTTSSYQGTQTSIWAGRNYQVSDQGYYSVQVIVLGFNTSALPDNAIVTGVSLTGTTAWRADTDGLSLVIEWYDDPVFAAGSWTSSPSNDAHAGTSLTSIVIEEPHTYTLSGAAGFPHISKGGVTGLRLHVSQRASNAAPTGENSFAMYAYEHASIVPPALVVNYVLPAALEDYDPTTWVDNSVAITAVRLNKIEGALDAVVDSELSSITREGFAEEQTGILSNALLDIDALRNYHPISATTTRTGLMMPAGEFAAQRVELINRSAFDLAFHTAPATSRIADDAPILPASHRLSLVWDPDYAGISDGRWVPTASASSAPVDGGGPTTAAAQDLDVEILIAEGNASTGDMLPGGLRWSGSPIAALALHADTAPTGGPLTVQVRAEDATVLGTVSLGAGQKEVVTESAFTPEDGQRLRIYATAVGSTTPAAGCTLSLLSNVQVEASTVNLLTAAQAQCTGGWGDVYGFTVTSDSVEQYDGENTLQLVSTVSSDAPFFAFSSPKTPVVDLQQYTAELYVKGPSGGSREHWLSILYYDDVGVQVGSSNGTHVVTTDNTYQRVAIGPLSAPPNCVTAALYYAVTNTVTSGDTFHIGAPKFVEGSLT